MLRKKGARDTFAKILDIAYENFRSSTPLDAEATLEGAKNIIDIVAGPGASRDPKSYLDAGVHDELAAEGFYKSMRAKYAVG